MVEAQGKSELDPKEPLPKPKHPRPKEGRQHQAQQTETLQPEAQWAKEAQGRVNIIPRSHSPNRSIRSQKKGSSHKYSKERQHKDRWRPSSCGTP